MMPQAIGDKIIVQKDMYKPTMEGGILIPECADRTPRFAPTVGATVVSVGKRVLHVRSGGRVACKIYAGDDFYHDNQRFCIMRERDIVGMIT